MAAINTREQILKAARKVFLEKGYAGSRMQEIAKTAQINKGLLHYYFTTKDNLFRAVFEEAFQAFIPQLQEIIESDQPIREKIALLIHSYMRLLLENPHLPAFIVNELNHNQEGFLDFISKTESRPELPYFFLQIQQASEKGEIAPVHPAHLILNIISMCVFPFLSKPVFIHMAGIREEDYLLLMKEREEEIQSLILKQLEL